MANKLSGELRLDLSTPATANDLAAILEDLDNQGIERGDAVITLQPAIAHQGGYRDPLTQPQTAGMQLVATWIV
jgi:hypothetical protein